MKLQLAIDCFTLDEALAISEEVADLVDIIEAGTPLILKEGIAAVRRLKREFPHLSILADMKIIDGAEYESRLAFDAGADIVTVVAAAEDETVAISRKTAEEYEREIMVDLIGQEHALARASEMVGLGAHYLCVHRSTDLGADGGGTLHDLAAFKEVASGVQIAVAGGIDKHALQHMKEPFPDIAIVGSYITGSSNRREAAMYIQYLMNR